LLDIVRAGVEIAILVHDEHPQPVARIEKLGRWRIVRTADRVRSHRLQPPNPPFPQRIGNGDAHARMILMIASALDLERLAVEEKALVGVEAEGAKADAQGTPVVLLTLARQTGAQRVEVGRIDGPELGVWYRQIKMGFPPGQWRHRHPGASLCDHTAPGVGQFDRESRICLCLQYVAQRPSGPSRGSA